MTYHSVFDVPRNNLQAAVVFLDAHWGKLRPEDISTLFQLQDDPTKLERLLAKLERSYRRPPVPRGGTAPRHGMVLRVGQQALPNWFRAIRTRDQKVVWVNRPRFLANPHKYHLPKEGPIPRGHRPPPHPPVVEPPGKAQWFKAIRKRDNKVIWVTRERFKAHPDRYELRRKPEPHPEPPKPQEQPPVVEPPKPEPPKQEQPPVVEPPGKAQWFKAIRKRDGKVIWVTRARFKAHPERYELRQPGKPQEKQPPREPPPHEQPPEAKKPLTPEFLQQQVRTLHRALSSPLTTRRNKWTGKVEQHLPTHTQAEIRSSVASILERVGLFNHFGHGSGYRPTGSRQYVVKDDLGHAEATHSWDGHVSVLTKVHNQAQRFFANPITASKEDVNGGRVLIHEEIHGHCNTKPGSYEGAGAFIEETTTEILAQHIMTEHFKRQPPFRAYNRECEKLENHVFDTHALVMQISPRSLHGGLGSVLTGTDPGGSSYWDPDARKALQRWISQAAIYMRGYHAPLVSSPTHHVSRFVWALMQTMPAAVKASMSDDEQSKFRSNLEDRINKTGWRK